MPGSRRDGREGTGSDSVGRQVEAVTVIAGSEKLEFGSP